METRPEKSQALTRLALCVILAVGLYAGAGKLPQLEPVPPEVYAGLREARLAGTAHIALSPEVIAYQAGGCALTPGGGLYALEAPHGAAVLCAEGMVDGRLLVKELLCDPSDLDWVLARLPGLLPGWSGLYRTPWGAEPFGMLKWLDPARERAWDWASTASFPTRRATALLVFSNILALPSLIY